MSLVSKPMLESLNGKQFVAGILLDRSKDALAEQSKLLSPAVVTVFLDHNGVSWHAEV